MKFDWDDPSTFPGVFNYELPGGEKIDTVYLVAPVTATPVDVVGPFIELARERGVKKFVLFTGSSCERGGWGPGKIWDFLEEGKKEGEVGFVVRATWFMGLFFCLFFRLSPSSLAHATHSCFKEFSPLKV